MLDGLWTVLDVKSWISEPYCRLQSAAYALAFTERTSIPIEQRVIVGLRNDGTHQVQTYTEGRADRSAWTSALALSGWFKRHGVRLA
jgi:hypothetical protein